MIDTKAFLTEAKTALVVIDLQRGIAGRQTAPHSGSDVVANAAKLVQAFRKAELPVIFVRVSFSATGMDALKPLVDEAPQWGQNPAGWDELVPELGVRPDDVIVTKRNWGGFYGTDLDLQLRRRAVQRIAICGIATHIGVESTARDAYERAYPLLFVEDAMAAMSAEEHAHALRYIFPRMGIIRSTADVLGALTG
jgi:nicotinamidase-related amidase